MTKTYHILAIGNSFSEDATRYLHQLAAASGVDTRVVNLYIGGCPLETHWRNIETGEEAYRYELNGAHTQRMAAIGPVLDEQPWDFIVTQQASHDSGWPDTYEPFLGLITGYLKEKVPGAKLFLQETWAYEHGSTHEKFPRYNRSQEEMYRRLRDCYIQMSDKYGLGLIPCGDVIQSLRALPEFDTRNGGLSLCRDGFHMSYDYGRYALACTWFAALFGQEPGEAFLSEEPELARADERLLALICRTAGAVVAAG